MAQDSVASFESSKFWASFQNDIRKWKTDYYNDKRRTEEFQKQLIELSSQMKGDLIYLDDALRNVKLDVTVANTTSTSQIFGSIQHSSDMDIYQECKIIMTN